jgi:hypothetical protein
MEFSRWVVENWFVLLQSVGIIGGLLLTASSLRSETKTRRVSNLLAITESHRKVWTEFYRRPELQRVLDERVDLRNVKREEEIFVNLVIFHLNSVFYARKSGLVFKLEGLRRDIWWFFSLPIPRMIWEKTKVLQNDDFVAFVEACRIGIANDADSASEEWKTTDKPDGLNPEIRNYASSAQRGFEMRSE